MDDRVEIRNTLEGEGILLAYKVLRVRNMVSSPCTDKALSRAEESIRERFRGDPSGLRGDPRVATYRKTMWRLGFDPTKIRPSMEALARRVVRGKRVPRINCIVDAGNAVSLSYLVPVGLYDIEKIRADTLYFTLLDGEAVFEPIGGGEKVLAPGTPVLVGGDGILHLYPSRDSRRTMVTGDTSRLLIVAYGAVGVPGDLLQRTTESVALLIEGCGCRG